MLDVLRERHVAAPPELLWPLVSDPRRLPDWFTFALAGEVLDGEGVGRRQRMYGEWGSKRSEIDQEVVEFDPPRRIAWVHLAERLGGKPAPRFAATTRFTIHLTPDGNGTQVRLHSAQEPASLVRGLVMRLFGSREIAQHLDRSLARLAATQEG
ncbi:MAG: SRPBCC domain-containing protein [Lapillicoccus sp.]